MSPKIFYVDDEPIFLKIVEIHLKRAGFRDFHFTQKNDAAVEAIRREQPDLVLLDITMPGVSGLDILKEMQDDCDLRRIPVLMVTASIAERRRKALKLGAQAVIAKPIDADELVHTVRDVASRASTNQEGGTA